MTTTNDSFTRSPTACGTQLPVPRPYGFTSWFVVSSMALLGRSLVFSFLTPLTPALNISLSIFLISVSVVALSRREAELTLPG